MRNDSNDRTICVIVKQKDGTHITNIIKNGETIAKVPTAESQIRAPRVSLLWKKDEGSFSGTKEEVCE